MLRILVVEDDTNLREMVCEWLIHEKFTVVSCETGAEAVEQMMLLRFDVLLLDWHLGDCTGIDLLTQYRQHQGKGVVLMLTGSTTNAEREEALKKGANGYMIKPFKLNELSQTIAYLLAGQT
jgi:DNA-binding response OmpR family regulator